MKQKNHSGLKKRTNVKKSGLVVIQKSCKNHLLSNKSKRQKKAGAGGIQVCATKMKAVRRLLPSIAGKALKRTTK